jgi:uncharacterized protein (TIGR02996 family)
MSSHYVLAQLQREFILRYGHGQCPKCTTHAMHAWTGAVGYYVDQNYLNQKAHLACAVCGYEHHFYLDEHMPISPQPPLTTADRLLMACWEQPHDMSVRLVYADYLEENGEPREAELVRLEVERLLVGTLRRMLSLGPRDVLGGGHFHTETSEWAGQYLTPVPGCRVDVTFGGKVARNVLITRVRHSPDPYNPHAVYLKRDGLSGSRFSAKRSAEISRRRWQLLTDIRGLQPLARWDPETSQPIELDQLDQREDAS